ncbi:MULTISPECIES: glycerophosphodiester phosphodiesterase [Caulobacter]|jgi:glycerophosphoryl diester phosphodiesterase|uniref:Glycerophosphoryl diester phosphodiesterase n=1 Tax=Caulobacter vibrioides OR37 TaxID=1292034 RepID=R0CZH5_CAUVI|nr:MULTISPECIES: glycerophosphodiester phosphodiesterase [Caulobacter]ENZ81645.1 glycerophosphoryl diester phosphodiesterase [Caulobacter vibrioides OR37]MBQ1562418.1 glycerophosphodiester phosphodiesterase [Caulobacter sp.]
MRSRERPSTEVFGEAWERLFEPPVAHRGLWTPDGAPENSLAAFQAACAHGYGIELDVQLTADGEAVVFHDDRLERMTGREGRLRDHTAAELGALALKGTDETIPTLADTLTLIGHRAMVFIELKTPFGDVGPLEKRVSDILVDHNGPTAVIGFNPYSHAWFADHHPQILRGLDSYGWNDDSARKLAPEMRKSLAALEQVELARPDFLALGLDMLPSPRADLYRAKGMPVIAWTIRSPDQWEGVRDHCDNLIFEGFHA